MLSQYLQSFYSQALFGLVKSEIDNCVGANFHFSNKGCWVHLPQVVYHREVLVTKRHWLFALKIVLWIYHSVAQQREREHPWHRHQVHRSELEHFDLKTNEPTRLLCDGNSQQTSFKSLLQVLCNFGICLLPTFILGHIHLMPLKMAIGLQWPFQNLGFDGQKTKLSSDDESLVTAKNYTIRTIARSLKLLRPGALNRHYC